MDIISIINEADPNVIIFLLTTFIAFISWLVKSLVEKPLTESKNTFIKYFEKRIEILTEINDIQPKIKELRKYDKYCKDIFKKSESIQNNLNNFDKDIQKEKDNSIINIR